MKVNYFTFFALLLILGCSDSTSSSNEIEFIDQETQKKIISSAVGEQEIEWKTQDPSGGSQELAFLTNPKKPYTGWVKAEHENGRISTLYHYKDGLDDGPGYYWYESGKKAGEDNWKKGKMISGITWKPNGEKCPSTHLEKGNGVMVNYNEDGSVESRDYYKNGEFIDEDKDGQSSTKIKKPMTGLLGKLLGGGPLNSAKSTATRASFTRWITGLYRYKEENGHFPPFLLKEQEGIPVILGPENQLEHNSFIAALKGKKWNTDNLRWEKLDGDLLKENRRQRVFCDLTDDDFGDEGYLADAWGGMKIYIVVDNNHDDQIELSSTAFNEIKEALKQDYDSATINAAEEKIKVIRQKIGIYVLYDKITGTNNVFSWDIKKYLEAVE